MITFEGTIRKITASSYDASEAGIHLEGESDRYGSQIGLTEEEVKSFFVGQRVRVTVEAVDGD